MRHQQCSTVPRYGEGLYKAPHPLLRGGRSQEPLHFPQRALDIQRESSSFLREISVCVKQLKEQLCSLGYPGTRERQAGVGVLPLHEGPEPG